MIISEDWLKVGTNNPALKWPSEVVPYVIEGSFNTAERNFINQAASNFGTSTGMRISWVLRTTQSDYVAITSDSNGCWSYVGRTGGRQPLNLQRGCLVLGIVEHEMLHALGIWHEQSRPDRDQFVSINWDNIEPGKEHNFYKKNPSQVLVYDSYDYGSVMHYSACAFTSNGRPTITPLDPNANIGQRNGMSNQDVQKLLKFYGVN